MIFPYSPIDWRAYVRKKKTANPRSYELIYSESQSASSVKYSMKKGIMQLNSPNLSVKSCGWSKRIMPELRSGEIIT